MSLVEKALKKKEAKKQMRVLNALIAYLNSRFKSKSISFSFDEHCVWNKWRALKLKATFQDLSQSDVWVPNDQKSVVSSMLNVISSEAQSKARRVELIVNALLRASDWRLHLDQLDNPGWLVLDINELKSKTLNELILKLTIRGFL